MRAQVVHNCVNEGNANAVTVSNKCIGYPVSGIRTATSLYPSFRGGGRNSPSRYLGRLNVDISRSLTIRQTRPVVLLCTSDQLVTEAATCTQHTTSTRDEHPCPQRVSNSRSQQSAAFDRKATLTLQITKAQSRPVHGAVRNETLGNITLRPRCLKR